MEKHWYERKDWSFQGILTDCFCTCTAHLGEGLGAKNIRINKKNANGSRMNSFPFPWLVPVISDSPQRLCITFLLKSRKRLKLCHCILKLDCLYLIPSKNVETIASCSPSFRPQICIFTLDDLKTSLSLCLTQ